MNLIYAGIRRVKWCRPNVRMKQFIVFKKGKPNTRKLKQARIFVSNMLSYGSVIRVTKGRSFSHTAINSLPVIVGETSALTADTILVNTITTLITHSRRNNVQNAGHSGITYVYFSHSTLRRRRSD
jgi:hypothetical protein